MIQDIFPNRLYNQFSERSDPDPEDMVLCFDGGRLLMKDGTMLPRVSDFPGGTEFTYLLKLDSVRFYLTRTAPEGFSWVETGALRRQAVLPKAEMFAVLTGKHLSDWYRDNRFCGRCGSAMVHSEKERAMTCPHCRYTAYPRIMPAVIVGVTNGDKLLLTKYRTGYGHNALIAGFTEIGETAEETVAREVMEEAGVRVKNIRYYKSQPWGIANDLLLGYYCDLDGDETITMDAGELRYAQWVKREDIELQPDDFSLTNEMMCRFKNGGKLPDAPCYVEQEFFNALTLPL